MLVRDVMTSNPKTARAVDSLDTVARIMWDNDCGCVPIVDDEGRVTAMVTDRDICMAAWSSGKPLARIPAHVAMSRALWSAQDTDDIESAETLMRTKRVRRMPVIDRSGKLVGVLSLGDVVRRMAVDTRKAPADDGLSTNRVAWTLAGISEPSTQPSAPRLVG